MEIKTTSSIILKTLIRYIKQNLPFWIFFWAYNLVTLGTFTRWFHNHHYNSSPEVFHHPKEKLCTQTITSHPPLLPGPGNQPLTTLFFLHTFTGSSVALMVQEQATRMKTEHEIWCNGSGDLQPPSDWGAESSVSPAVIPDCTLQGFLRSYLSPDTSLDLLVFTPGRSLLG